MDRCRVAQNSEVKTRNQTIIIDGNTYFKTISNIVLVNSSETDSVISSLPVRVCFCAKEDQPDCNYKPPPILVKKGGVFNVSLVAVDQVMDDVTIFSSLQLPKVV